MPRSHVTRGFDPSGPGGRAPLSAAWAWLDAHSPVSSAEVVPLADAMGRVLAEPLIAGGVAPERPRSAENGYAVHSADCDGATAYTPLMLRLLEPGTDELAAGFACVIASGRPLPSGADAVLPFEAAQPLGPGSLEVLAPVAPGTGSERWRNALPAGATMLEAGLTVMPRHLGYLAAMGVERVTVSRRPRVAVVVPGAKSGPDALTPMLRALLVRDAALMEQIQVGDGGELALTTALTNARISACALVLVCGCTGSGPDDTAADALVAAGGTLALHGLALRPGLASGLGTLPRPGETDSDAVPVVLLPGDPLACLAAYDMLAARLVRRLAGTGTILPYAVAEFELARKIVSEIGTVEIVPVRLANGRAAPIGADAGLAGAARADGFVMVAEPSEGQPAGSRVRVHLYDTTGSAAAREMKP